MTDLFARTQAEFVRHQAEFLHIELATCSRAADLATTMRLRGDQKSAERTMADAEQGYAALVRLVSDPQHAKRVPIRESQELGRKIKALRQRLGGLRQPK